MICHDMYVCHSDLPIRTGPEEQSFISTFMSIS